DPGSTDSNADSPNKDDPQVPGLEGTVEELMIRKMPPSMSKYLLESLGKDINDLPNSGNSD
ncbi:hypothetical protein MHBO_003737, partial [Bonamia ostreae]